MIDLVLDAQGEDVVAGRRTPDTEDTIARALPAVAAELGGIFKQLEKEFRDVQDIEFTIEDAKLWILQTRSAKRTPRASLRIAIDLVHEGIITQQEALHRLEGIDLAALNRTALADAGDPVASGIGAAGGVAAGRAAFDSESAQRLAASGDPAILMRPDTSTADVAGFAAAAGIITAVGARTAHAALVARQLGKPCIVGCSSMTIDADTSRANFAGTTIAEGDWISIDGDSGHIYQGRREIIITRPESELAEVNAWRSNLHRPNEHESMSAHDQSAA
jgi:pyruvate,orthophosphate dikinase